MNPDKLSKRLKKFHEKLADIRSEFDGIVRGSVHASQLGHIHGSLTTTMVALYSEMKDVLKSEILSDDRERGRHIKTVSRGLGLDRSFGCFICGRNESGVSNNLSLFVDTVEDGRTLIEWFRMPAFNGSYLDFRSSEPAYIQVKIVSCEQHKFCLQEIDSITRSNGNLLRESDLEKFKEIV